jgi:hypothetical protein
MQKVALYDEKMTKNIQIIKISKNKNLNIFFLIFKAIKAISHDRTKAIINIKLREK